MIIMIFTYKKERINLKESGKRRAGSGSLLCYLSRGLFFYPMGPGFLPTKPFGYAQGRLSRLCSCLSLIIAVHLNKTYRGSLIGDLHPISPPRGIDYPTGFMPMPGVHKKIQTDAKNARLILPLCRFAANTVVIDSGRIQ